VAAEHATQFDDDWLRGQLVAAAQLAVGLDFESRALGFKLVSFETWQQRLRSVELDLHELDEPLPATLAELRRH
jgi:hypothetical protein